MDIRRLTLIAVVVVSVIAMSNGIIALPFGATPTEISDQRAPADAAGSNDALAGNITELTISAFSITQSWQGYMGNVTGTIQLADASDNVLYNWSLASPEGEVFASNSSAVTWTNIQCLNFTANGSLVGDSGNGGATSQGGLNLSQIENMFNISSDDVDGLNETFSLLGTHESGQGFNHTNFYVNNLQFSEAECLSTHLMGSAGTFNDAQFEEVLLYDPDGVNIVFATLLDEDVVGFDGATHDFEMIVLEDGHGTNTATTTYYFYVELE